MPGGYGFRRMAQDRIGQMDTIGKLYRTLLRQSTARWFVEPEPM